MHCVSCISHVVSGIKYKPDFAHVSDEESDGDDGELILANNRINGNYNVVSDDADGGEGIEEPICV